MTQFKEQIEEIVRFGKSKGFNFADFTTEQMDVLMSEWIENGRKFQVAISEYPVSGLRKLIGL